MEHLIEQDEAQPTIKTLQAVEDIYKSWIQQKPTYIAMTSRPTGRLNLPHLLYYFPNSWAAWQHGRHAKILQVEAAALLRAQLQ